MSRPADWSPLAASDPTPGDQTQIRQVSRRYRDFAAELEQQASSLRQLANAEGWDAGAGRAFASTATDVAEQLGKARERYRSVGEALNTYANELAQAQFEADAALREAKQAETDHKAKQTAAGVNPAMQGPPAPGSPEVPDLDISGPMNRMRRAVDERDAAGRRASDRIREAISNDGLKDNWWDKVKDWSGKTLDSFVDLIDTHAGKIKSVADFMGDVAFVVGMIATVVAWIPGVNVLAPALLTIAAMATAVSLVCNLALALSGNGSWIDVGLDVVGLVTFGFGRGAVRAAIKGQRALKGSAEKMATRQARAYGEKMVAAAKRHGAPLTANARKAMTNSMNEIAKKQGKAVVDQIVDLPRGSLARWGLEKGQKLAGRRAGNFLGVDGEVMLKSQKLKDLVAVAPDYKGVKDAMVGIQRNLNIDKAASSFQTGVDMVDRFSDGEKFGHNDKAVQIREGWEKATTWDRYASASNG